MFDFFDDDPPKQKSNKKTNKEVSDQNICDILYRYKYGNISLEKTIINLLSLYNVSSNCLTVSYQQNICLDLSESLTKYKFNAILKVDVIANIRDWFEKNLVQIF